MSTREQARQEREGKFKEIFPSCDFFSIMGVDDYNFALPPNEHVTESQIEKLRAMGYAISSFEAVVNHSGMTDHLHVWIDKIQSWSKI